MHKEYITKQQYKETPDQPGNREKTRNKNSNTPEPKQNDYYKENKR
jgi:hypothetical protein